jgi:hypothetical protein
MMRVLYKARELRWGWNTGKQAREMCSADSDNCMALDRIHKKQSKASKETSETRGGAQEVASLCVDPEGRWPRFRGRRGCFRG